MQTRPQYEEAKAFAIIFAGIAVIYCPLLFLSLNIDQVDIALTLALFVLGHKRFKE